MTLEDALYEMSNIAERYISTMDSMSAEQLGLDKRAGYMLYVNDEAIAVEKRRDGSLQYYGGFEYIDKELRFDFGDYVIYMIDRYSDSDEPCRVKQCIDRITHTESLDPILKD